MDYRKSYHQNTAQAKQKSFLLVFNQVKRTLCRYIKDRKDIYNDRKRKYVRTFQKNVSSGFSSNILRIFALVLLFVHISRGRVTVLCRTRESTRPRRSLEMALIRVVTCLSLDKRGLNARRKYLSRTIRFGRWLRIRATTCNQHVFLV